MNCLHKLQQFILSTSPLISHFTDEIWGLFTEVGEIWQTVILIIVAWPKLLSKNKTNPPWLYISLREIQFKIARKNKNLLCSYSTIYYMQWSFSITVFCHVKVIWCPQKPLKWCFVHALLWYNHCSSGKTDPLWLAWMLAINGTA